MDPQDNWNVVPPSPAKFDFKKQFKSQLKEASDGVFLHVDLPEYRIVDDEVFSLMQAALLNLVNQFRSQIQVPEIPGPSLKVIKSVDDGTFWLQDYPEFIYSPLVREYVNREDWIVLFDQHRHIHEPLIAQYAQDFI